MRGGAHGTAEESRNSVTCAGARRSAHRSTSRRRALGPVVARLVGGSEVRLMDFARRGVLLESDTRLLIGAKATIKITTTDTTISVRGHVVRSRVAGVKGGALMYHTALALEEDLGLMESVAPRQGEPAFDDRRARRTGGYGRYPHRWIGTCISRRGCHRPRRVVRIRAGAASERATRSGRAAAPGRRQQLVIVLVCMRCPDARSLRRN